MAPGLLGDAMTGRIETRQRHSVTVGFCDICGSTSIGRKLDLETYSDFLRDVWKQTRRIISDLGGTVLKIEGDGMMFMFGYPDTFEDSSRRAVEASLRLRNWAADFTESGKYSNVELQFHTGINSGVVLVHEDDPTLGEFDILGDAINTAKRLSDHAAADEIVISANALGADRHFFDLSTPEWADRSEPTPRLYASKVLGWRQSNLTSRPNLRHEATPMVGRDADLKWITSFLQTQQSQCLAIIRARQGMGKSRLLSEAMAQAKAIGHSVHWCYCSSYPGHSRFDPIEQLLRSMRVHNGQQDVEVSVELKQLAVPELVDVFLQTAERLKQQLTLFLDDWHWASDTSRTFLEILVERAPAGLKIVLSERPEKRSSLSSNRVKERSLAPLSRADTERVIHRIEPTLDAFAVSDIYERSGGNPLFVEELSYAYRHNQTADVQGSAWLYATIQNRFHALSDEQRALVEVASVIGRVVPRWLIVSFFDTELDDAVLASLSDADFIYPDETTGHLRFKHGVACEAIYQLLSATKRRQINARIAEILEDRPGTVSAGELALYYFRSDNLERALQCAIEAGETALEDRALDKVQYHFQSALEHCIQAGFDEEQTVQLVRYYGRVCIVDPNRKMVGVLEALRLRAQEMGFRVATAWCGYYIAFVNYGLGQVNKSIEGFAQVGAQALELGLDLLKERVEATQGQVVAAGCRGMDAMRIMDRSIEIQRQQLERPHPPAALAYTMASKGFSLMDMGAIERGRAILGEATDLVKGGRTAAEMSILSYAGTAEIFAGQFEAASDILSGLQDLAKTMRSRFHMSGAAAFRSIAKYFISGDMNTLEDLEHYTEQWRRLSEQRISFPYGHLAEFWADLGEDDSARRYAHLALKRALEGDRFGETGAHRALARIAHSEGDLQARDIHISSAQHAAKDRDSLRDQCLTGYFEERLVGSTNTNWAELAATMSLEPKAFFPKL